MPKLPAPSPQVLVPLTPITCLVPIIAEPGDHLLIFNGFCIGLSTSGSSGQEAASTLPPKLLSSPPTKPKRGRPKGPRSLFTPRRPTSTSHPHPHLVSVEVNKRMSTVTHALTNSPMHLGALARTTGFTKAQVKVALKQLDSIKALQPPTTRGTGNRRLYTLASSPSSRQEAPSSKGSI